MDYPKPIKDLIDSFVSLPSIGKKTAERLALYVFSDMDEDTSVKFSKAIINVKNELHRCTKCHNQATNKNQYFSCFYHSFSPFLINKHCEITSIISLVKKCYSRLSRIIG